jgi:hypothetical protein
MLYSSFGDSPVLKVSPHCQKRSAATELIAVVCQGASELQKLVDPYSSRRHGLPAFLQAWPWAVIQEEPHESASPPDLNVSAINLSSEVRVSTNNRLDTNEWFRNRW